MKIRTNAKKKSKKTTNRMNMIIGIGGSYNSLPVYRGAYWKWIVSITVQKKDYK